MIFYLLFILCFANFSYTIHHPIPTSEYREIETVLNETSVQIALSRTLIERLTTQHQTRSSRAKTIAKINRLHQNIDEKPAIIGPKFKKIILKRQAIDS